MKFKPCSYRKVVKALGKLGFRVVRQKGSHLVLKGFFKERKRTVVVPKHKEIAVGTFAASCFRQDLLSRSFSS